MCECHPVMCLIQFRSRSYQDLADLEESVSSASASDLTVSEFDTSCFSGTYVTGEKIGDEYFSHLHELRNDQAQEERRGSVTAGTSDRKRPLPRQSNDGCESMTNDKRTIGLVS